VSEGRWHRPLEHLHGVGVLEDLRTGHGGHEWAANGEPQRRKIEEWCPLTAAGVRVGKGVTPAFYKNKIFTKLEVH
jgi:hypothetical protein